MFLHAILGVNEWSGVVVSKMLAFIPGMDVSDFLSVSTCSEGTSICIMREK